MHNLFSFLGDILPPYGVHMYVCIMDYYFVHN